MTAEDFLVSKAKTNDKDIVLCSINNGDYTVEMMVAFAKYHVEEAIAEIARVEANSIEEANEDKEYMLNMYPLTNIK